MSKKFLIMVCLLFFTALLAAEELEINGLGLGINYPGLGIKYCFNNKIIELRFQGISEKSATKEDNTTLIGLRFYKYCPLNNKSLFYYFGGELSCFNYLEKVEDLNANGYATGVYIGIDKFLSSKFSLNFDIGPYYAQSSKSGDSADVFDFILNLSMNYYFGGLQK